MSDDWRLKIELHDEGRVHALAERLDALALERGIRASFGDQIAVSRDGSELFCYTGTQAQADQVAALIDAQAAEHGWQVESELKRWHPVAAEWQDPSAPLPQTDEQLAAEHEQRILDERRDAEALGEPEWEVRIECGARDDARQLCSRLRGEGLAAVSRWRYVFVGADDEDAAQALAERLRAEIPPDAQIVAEGTLRAAARSAPPNPFAFLGGLGG